MTEENKSEQIEDIEEKVDGEESHPLFAVLSAPVKKKEDKKPAEDSKSDKVKEEKQKDEKVGQELQEDEDKKQKDEGKQAIKEAYSPLKEPEEEKKDQKPDDKTLERLNSARKGFLQTSRKLSEGLKILKTLEEDGTMTEDEAKSLRDVLTHDVPDDLVIPTKEKDEPDTPVQQFLKIVSPEIENMKKYSDDPDFQDYIISFNRWFFTEASAEDKENALAILEKMFDDPAELAKKTASIGKRLYQDIYTHVKEAGGIHALIQNHKSILEEKESQIETLQKKIDKLLKKEKDEEDYIPAKTYKVNGIKDPSFKGNKGDARKAEHPIADLIS